MKPISEIRLANLESLIAEAGTADELASRADLSAVYISQIRARAIDVKTGRPRSMGSVAARKLEIGMGKPSGWMDRDHNDRPNTSGDWPFPRLDPSLYGALSQAQRDAIEEWVTTQVHSFLSPVEPKSNSKKTA